MFTSSRVDDTHRFRYASLSKLITANATLGLISEGRLSLSDRLIDFFPELPALKDPRIDLITVEHLLRHQAGFDRLKSEDVMFKHHHRPWCPYDLDNLAKVVLDFDPGKRQSYSNRGYCLLGQLIERVTGQSYRTYVQGKYQLNDTSIRFIDGPYLADEVRYDFRNEDFYEASYFRYFDFHALSSVAGLAGNASDLAIVLKRSYNPEFWYDTDVLGKQCDMTRIKNCYGYAVYHYKQQDKELVTYVHDGRFPGALSWAVMDNFGGVLVILTSGVPRDVAAVQSSLVGSIYKFLGEHYASGN